MGSWGVGLRENDDAGDAIDLLRGGEERQRPEKIRALLRRADRLAGSQAVLGLAEELLERGADMRSLENFLTPYLASESSARTLAAWQGNSANRKRQLIAFAQRIKNPPLTSRKRDKQSLDSKDPSGKDLFRVPQSEKKPASEGLQAVSKGGKWGYVGRKAHLVIPLRYDDADPFHHGVARVSMGEGRGRRYGLIDAKGRYILKPVYPVLGQFSEGLARIEIRGKEGYINEAGKVIIKAVWDEACPFEQGRAIVIRGKRYGFIDKRGELLTGLLFDQAADFVEGLARIRQKGLWGFIDMDGKLAIQPRFIEARDFQDGRASVTIKEGKRLRSGQINRAGTIVALCGS